MAPNIATNTAVELDELLAFVRPRHRAILLTTRSDGRPQGSPLTCGVDDAGRIVVSTYPERAKTRNAKRDARVSVIVLSDEWNGPWVQVDGSAEVIDSPESAEPLVEYFRNISGEHPDWDEYRAAMVKQGKSIIRITWSGGGRSPPAASRPVWRPTAERTAGDGGRRDRRGAEYAFQRSRIAFQRSCNAPRRSRIASMPAISRSRAKVKSRSRISSTVSPPRASITSCEDSMMSLRCGWSRIVAIACW